MVKGVIVLEFFVFLCCLYLLFLRPGSTVLCIYGVFPPQNPDQNPGQKSGQKPDQKSSQKSDQKYKNKNGQRKGGLATMSLAEKE